MYYLGLDVGGTFTDVVVMDEAGDTRLCKVESTPGEPAVGLMAGIKLAAEKLGLSEAGLLQESAHLAHGTTIATNALLERKGAKVGLIMTKGFGDTMFIQRLMGLTAGLSTAEIRHYSRRNLPLPIVPASSIKEVTERVDYKGSVVIRLNEEEARRAIRELVAQGVAAIAVCFLWSFRYPAHEQAVKRIAAEEAPELLVSLSSEVMPVVREYERACTTVFNVYLAPSVSSYIGGLEGLLRQKGLKGALTIVSSSGGVLMPEQAKSKPIYLINSGPAGGVISSMYLGEALGYDNIITTDMGGTSFDVGFIVDRRPILARTKPFIKYLLHVPMIDIATLGAGGGSIARVEAGELRVGPQSAGAYPGPACYGKGGTEPTVTDADVVLGLIDPDYFLGGRIKLDKAKAEEVIREKIAGPLGIDVIHAAAGMKRVLDNQMADLLRTLILAKGYDPRDFVMFAFGGAGPSHCASYGAELGFKGILVPYTATVHSAFGAAGADLVHAVERAEIMRTPMFFDVASKYLDYERFNSVFQELEEQSRQMLISPGIDKQDITFYRSVDLRYRRQTFELAIPVPGHKLTAADIDNVVAEFDQTYEKLYGPQTAFREAGVEITLFRVEAVGKVPKPTLKVYEPVAAELDRAVIGERQVYFYKIEDFRPTTIYDGMKIGAGHVIQGPTIVQQPGTTVVINPGQQGKVDRFLNILIEQS